MASNQSEYPDLFVDVSVEAEKGISDAELLGPFGLRARLVELTSAAYEDIDRVNVNLFPVSSLSRTRMSSSADNRPLELTAIFEDRSEEGGAIVRLGMLEDDPDSTISLAAYDGVVSFTLSSPRYGLFDTTVFSEQARQYVLRELNEQALPDCGVGRVVDRDKEYSGGEDGDNEEDHEHSELEEDAITSIDLLIVYTTPAKTALGGVAGTRARAAEAVRRGNQTLNNSALSNVRINLVATEELPGYTESSGLSGFYTMLNQLVAGTATGLTGLHALRNRVKADMVSLLVANPSLGGLANIMQGVSSSFARLAYSVVNYGVAASTWTLIHELGHNFGCCHETACNRVRTYAKGHSFTAGGQKLKTVMVRKSEPGTRIPFFSNPNVTYKGVATGVANTRDNARAVRTAAPTVAAFR